VLPAAVFTANALLSKPVVPDVRLTSIEGESLRLADLRGQVVPGSFWATCCVTCMEDAADRRHPAQKMPGAAAEQYARPDWVIDDNERNRLPFPIALDLQGGITRAFDDKRVTATAFLIETPGRIFKRYIGAPGFAELQPRIAALLAG
jgi:peroxiredoxin